MLFSCVSRFVFVLQGPLLIFFVYVIDVEAADVACLHLFCVPICICLFASVHVDSVSCSMHVPVICCLYHSCFFFPCLLLHQSLFVCPFLRSTGWCPSVRSISVYVSCLLLLSLPVYCESLLFFFSLSCRSLSQCMFL